MKFIFKLIFKENGKNNVGHANVIYRKIRKARERLFTYNSYGPHNFYYIIKVETIKYTVLKKYFSTKILSCSYLI